MKVHPLKPGPCVGTVIPSPLKRATARSSLSSYPPSSTPAPARRPQHDHDPDIDLESHAPLPRSSAHLFVSSLAALRGATTLKGPTGLLDRRPPLAGEEVHVDDAEPRCARSGMGRTTFASVYAADAESWER